MLFRTRRHQHFSVYFATFICSLYRTNESKFQTMYQIHKRNEINWTIDIMVFWKMYGIHHEYDAILVNETSSGDVTGISLLVILFVKSFVSTAAFIWNSGHTAFKCMGKWVFIKDWNNRYWIGFILFNNFNFL